MAQYARLPLLGILLVFVFVFLHMSGAARDAGGGGGAASVGRASREAVAQERSTLNRELNTLQSEIATLRGVDPAASPATRAGTGGRAAALRRALARRAAARSDGGGGGDGSEEKPAPVLTEVRTPPAHDGRLIRVGAENLTAVTVTGTIKVVAAVMVCNCPSLVGDGSASALLKLSKEGDAFVHSYPFHEQYGDANGLKDVTASAREACDGKETCAYSLRSERPPVSSCQPKLALEYACATSEEAATSEAAYLLLRSNLRFSTKVLAPQMDSVGAALSCSAPALAAGLERFAAVVASPERARLRRAGEFAEADAVTVDVTRTAGPKYDQATTTKQIRGARPVTYEAEGYRFNSWPVQFSIPSVRFANTVAWKKEGMQFAPAIPGNKNTYQNLATKWNSEEVPPDDAFWSDYRHSYYCVTRKKKGWDCLRHYEILATGCVPYFVDIHRLPAATMPFFPRQLVMEAMALPGVTFHDTKEGSFLNRTAYTIDHNVFPKERYFKLAAQIQEHARRHLTSEAMAQYVLDALAAEGGPKRARKVLYIHHCYHDFLGDSLWAGFKELEAQGKLELVADIVPPRELSIGGADGKAAELSDLEKCEHGRKTMLMSSQSSLSKKGFYAESRWAGWGNHRAFNAFPKETAVDPQTMPDRIAAKEFDVVVYGTAQRTLAWSELVEKHYKPNEVAMMCGSDAPPQLRAVVPLAKTGTLFTREMYDEPGGYVNREVCTDSPGVAETQGFDCCSWDRGGSRVVWSSPDANGKQWRKCGKEDDMCTCEGEVRFGDPVRKVWTQLTLAAPTTYKCKNVNAGGPFVDPAVGYAKICTCLVEGDKNIDLA